MSERELTRVEVLGRVKAGTLSLGSAATLMAVSYRQAKGLARRHQWRRSRSSPAPSARSPLEPALAIYDAIVPAGEPWIHEIARGQYLRIVDVEGNQAADTLFYNAHDYEDRYSAQDTIREQANICLTTW